MGAGKRKQSLLSVMILFFALIILPTNLCMIYFARQSKEIIIRNEIADLEHIANIYMSDLDAQMRNINNFVNMLEEKDVSLARICSERNWDEYYIAGMRLRNVMEEHMALYGDANAYFYFSEPMQHGMVVENVNSLTRERLREALFSEECNLEEQKWKMMEVDGTRWLIHVNCWKDVYVGAGVLLDDMLESIRNNMENKPISVFIDAQEETVEADGEITVTRQCGKREVYLHLRVSQSDIVSSLSALQQFVYNFAFADLLLIPLLILVLRCFVLEPLDRLNAALGHLKDDASYRIADRAGTRDFDAAYRSFNKMADEIVELKIDNYEHRLRRRKMELNNLRLQIKPHFLFNSLNLMYNLVQIHEYRSVQVMLLYLSDYFRYINAGDHDFSLFHEEYELIQKYLNVASIRYPDTFETEYEVEDAALEAMVPQLLVHNFVENIVKHGLNLQKKNHIFLQAKLRGGDLVICVKDDGVGMPEEQAKSISQGNFTYADGKKHLGLENSYRRIQYYYGENGSMQIVSETGSGTEITLRFPAQVMEDESI